MTEKKVFITSYGWVFGDWDNDHPFDLKYSLNQPVVNIYQGQIFFPLSDIQQKRVKSFCSEDKFLNSLDRVAKLGIYAASGAKGSYSLGDNYGVVFGTSRGASNLLLGSYERYFQNKPLKPSTSPLTTQGILSSALAKYLNISGPSFTLSSACSSSLQAIGTAFNLIKSDQTDGMITGGSESCLDSFTLSMLKSAKVYCSESSITELPYKPFHQKRSGLCLGEGSASLLLESKRRNPDDLEILSFSATTEKASLTGIDPEAIGLQKAILNSLEKAGISNDQIGLIVAHGAGTIKGDRAELACYEKIFAKKKPSLIYYKWFMGHSLGASTALSMCILQKQLSSQKFDLPPYESCASHDFSWPVKNSSYEYILVTSLGFGGHSGAMILKKP